jgi:predicted ferric reductase
MRRPIVLGVALGALVLLVLDAVAARSGLGPSAVPMLPGSSAWLTSRAAGVTAFLALSLDVAFGLFISTGVADRAIPRARIVEAHRFLSGVTLALTALHAAALLGDRFIRFDVLDVLVPLVSKYRPLSIGLGLFAAYLAIVIHQSFAWRKRLGAKLWRSLHYASFVAYAVALLHGVFAGTDVRGLSGVYLASSSLIGALLLYRVAIARRHPASARG